MSSRIQYEAWLMVLSLVTGGWLMLAYDTLRVFRLVIRHGPFWTGVEAVFPAVYKKPVKENEDRGGLYG